QTSITAPFNWPWAFIRPATTFSFTQYRLDHQPSGNDDTPSRSQPQFSLDAGLFFERPVEVSAMAFTQTLEPRLLLVETPARDQSQLPNFDSGELTFNFSQLFRPDRFSGRDRIGDTRQATLGLTSRLLTPQGSERLTLSAGQIFYFEHRQVRLDADGEALTDDRSAFAAEADWQATPELRLGADLLMSEELSRNLARNLKLSYRSDLDHQFNASYRFTDDKLKPDDKLEQVDLSAIWPLSPQWSLLTRWLYDLDNSEPLDQILGLEYENCCWRIRALYRHWVNESADQRENNGVFLQFVLKGLGRVGAQAAGDDGSLARSFLKEISGFEEREDL
ncbi:MAG TPA: LPS assembly protein LptD, partial [Motiliproteus sp.]